MAEQGLAKMEHSTTLVIGPDAGAAAEGMVQGATGIANVLANIINDRKLFNDIQGKRHVRVEGWTTLGAMLGVIAKEESTHRMTDGSWEAKVVLLRQKDGVVVGGASGMCSPTETRWDKAPEYARRSMAVTRATSKAFRLALSWVMVLAGYEATPAEEMDGVVAAPTPAPREAVVAKQQKVMEVKAEAQDMDKRINKTPIGGKSEAPRYGFQDKPKGAVLAGWENKAKYWCVIDDMSNGELLGAHETCSNQAAWETDNGKDTKWTDKDLAAIEVELRKRQIEIPSYE